MEGSHSHSHVALIEFFFTTDKILFTMEVLELQKEMHALGVSDEAFCKLLEMKQVWCHIPFDFMSDHFQLKVREAGSYYRKIKSLLEHNAELDHALGENVMKNTYKTVCPSCPDDEPVRHNNFLCTLTYLVANFRRWVLCFRTIQKQTATYRFVSRTLRRSLLY